MKKILFLLLSTVAMYGQVPADATPLENIQITNNTTDNSATKVNVQSTDGTINTISKSDLANVVEVNDVPTLPLVGEVGKIYVVKNVNKIYRWNGTFYQELAVTDISGLQAQIDLKVNDSAVVKLTGNQTISGQKSFSLTGKIDMQTNNGFPAITATALGSNGQIAAEFINNSSSPYSSALNLQTSLSGGVGNVTLSVWNQSSIGTGIVSIARSGGVSISSQSGNGDSYVSNITDGGTGRNYVGRNNGTETYSVDKTGNVIGNSYIKRSTPANNILLAGGGDLAQNTAFNKNFGTTAGTVVEGGTLGSNAYNSTAYLPLTGGDITGGVNATNGFSSTSSTGSGVTTRLHLSNTNPNNGSGTSIVLGSSAAEGSGNARIVGTAFSGNDFRSQIQLQTTTTAGVWNSGIKVNENNVVTIGGLSGTGTRAVVADASGNLSASGVGYKVYTALLTQSGTNAPVATVLENTLGGTVVWTRNSTGSYTGTLAGVFTANKTFTTNTFGTFSGLAQFASVSVDTVNINTTNSSGTLTDGFLNRNSIEIRVYN